MATEQTETNRHIEQLTQFLLINQLCGQNDSNEMAINYNYLPFNNKDKQKQKNQSYKIASYISPFFMTSSQQQINDQLQERQIKQCMRNSKQSQNLQTLLKNVFQLPKLRYQQSQKLFQLQTSNYPNDNQSNKKTNKLNFQTPQNAKNASRIAINLQQTQPSSDYPYAQSTKEKLTPNYHDSNYPNGKKLLDMNESSFEEQMDIEINMSARSQRSNRQFINRRQQKNLSLKDYQNKERQNIYMIKKRKQPSNHVIFQTQSQKKARQQKSFIQNYFQSAKNQIMENCSLNCCQGMFGQEELKQNKNKVTMRALQLKQDKKLK